MAPLSAVGSHLAVWRFGQQSFQSSFDVDAGRVEKRNLFALVAENKRQLCTSEDQALNAITLLHRLYYAQQRFMCFGQESSVDELAHIALVNEVLFFNLRDHDCHTGSCKCFLVEARLHSKTSAEKPESLESTYERKIAGGLHDAHQWNWRDRSQFVEYKVRGIRRQQSEIGASSRQS